VTPQDALDYAKRFVGNMPFDNDTIKYRVLDDAAKQLWMHANWSWTVDNLEVVTWVNDQQDHQLSAAPSDFYQLVEAYAWSGAEKIPLLVTHTLPADTANKGIPARVSWYEAGENEYLRFLPCPAGYTTAPKVYSIYKQTHTDVAVGNIATEGAAGCPDEWFWVYQEIVLGKAFSFTHDPRLGQVQAGPQGAVYTGQLGVIAAALGEMRRIENPIYGPNGEVVNG